MTRVLAVDDNPAIRELLHDWLRRHGFEVETAGDAVGALAAAHRSPPDVVVSDLQMPGMDGYALLRTWKADPVLCRVPFVVRTAAYCAPGHRQLAHDLGADAIVADTIDPDAVLAAVRAVVERTQRGAPPARPDTDAAAALASHNELLLDALRRKLLELEQTNRQLDDTAAGYRVLFEANPHPMWVYDLETLRFLAVNDAAIGHYGWSRAEFGALTIADIRPAHERARLLEHMAQRAAAPSPASAIWRHCKRDGSTIDVEIRSHEIDFEGRRARLVLAHDVTQRLAAERALLASEARFRASFEQAAVGMAHVAADGRWLLVNERLCEIVGYTREELLARSVADVTHPQDYARDRELSRAVLAGTLPSYGREKRYLRKDGAEVWVHVVTTLVRDAGGAGHFSSVINDITERKRAEAEVRRLLQAIEQSSESIVITDVHSSIEYVNHSFVAVSGYSREEVLGRNPRVLQSGRTPLEVYRSLHAALGAGRAWSGEFHNRRKDGTEYVESATISPIRAADGTVTHYLAVKTDITEKRRIAEELERHRHRLEELVAERTTQLTEARCQAEAASRAKSAFLANMSHEIRTPMNGVLGMLEVLLRSGLTDAQADMVRTAGESGRALLGIIDDILDFSKIEAGRLEIERGPVAVSELVEGMAESMLPAALQQQVDLDVFVEPDLPARVLTDALRLRQILFNLVGNAIKFSGGRDTKPGQVALRVTMASRAPLELAFEVIDNGIGIAPAKLGQLFEVFTQAEVSTTRRFGGSGLGLAVCKRLADLMGSRIIVASTPGEGSSFTLRLPVQADPSVAVAAPALLRGVVCRVDERGAFDADGVCRYLEHAGAQVRRHVGDDGAGVAGTSACPVVEIRYVGRTRAVEAAPSRPHVRQLLINRGRPRELPGAAQNCVTIDGNAMRREALLAAVAVAAGRASPPRAPGSAALAPPPPSPAHGARILVAEDDEVNRQVIRLQLELLGYRPVLTCNGAEALQRWRDGGFALLLTDLHMPEMDGYDLVRAIRQHERASGAALRAPIVALSANALRGEAERAREQGVDDYLTKPLQLEQLRIALMRWLPGADAAGPPAPTIAPAPPLEARGGAVLDLAQLERSVGDDAQQVRRFLALFVDNARRQHDEIRAAAAAGAAAHAGATAHKLKSASRTVGALALGELCAALEQSGRAGDLDALRGGLGAFEAEFARVAAQVDALLAAAAA